jgi:Bardet-Biedl syndrome 2 protein
MEDLKEILTKLGELRKVREALTAEIADHSSIIRNLVVRAEDARLMDEM